jgi:hypothetical protein
VSHNSKKEFIMKCVKKGSDIRRVSDQRSVKLVSEGYVYCPKTAWKKTSEKTCEEDEVVVKKANPNKKAKGTKAEKAEAKKAAKVAELATADAVKA